MQTLPKPCRDCDEMSLVFCEACQASRSLASEVLRQVETKCHNCTLPRCPAYGPTDPACDYQPANTMRQAVQQTRPLRVRTVLPLDRTNASQVDPMLPDWEQIDWRNLAGWALALCCLVLTAVLVVMQAR